jgi:hypothetical protein
MAGSGKRKTTMAKLTRESKLREKRMEKQARKVARKLEAANPPETPSDHDHLDGEFAESATSPLHEDLAESATRAAEPSQDQVAETVSDA